MTKYLRVAAILIVFSAILLAQSAKVLIVNGKNAGPATLQSNGRTYVDVAILAEALNGSVGFEGDRVILTLPGAPAGNETAADSDAEPEAMSREFANGGLNAIGLMRDFKVAVETMIAFQMPAAGTYYQDLQYNAEEGLRRAKLVASTNPDNQAYAVLERGYGKLARWAGSAIATRNAMDGTRTSNTDYLKYDVELQKITECGRALSAMLVSLQFADIPSCY